MDALAGYAVRKIREEINRKIQDRGLFSTTLQKRPPSGGHASINAEKGDRFLQEELASRSKQRRIRDRQTLVWVLLGSLLPLLVLVLQHLFF